MQQFNPINKGTFIQILKNIIFVIRKTGAYDVKKILCLLKKVDTDPERVLDELIELLKSSTIVKKIGE